MKLCMIGCGNFARQFHGPAQQRCAAQDPGLELAACCDIEADRARDYGAAFGFARHYTDLLAMLAAERPDAVVLAVPPAITCGAASLVLARGFPLLLEKPPGISPGELATLIKAAEQGRVGAQVGFNRRYMPVMRRAREIIDGAFATTPVGRIDYEMLRFDRWDPDFSTTAVHAIDAVRFLAGSPFRTARLNYQPLTRDSREAAGISLELECVSGLLVRVGILPVAGCNTESAKIHTVGQTLAIKLPYPGKIPGDGTVEHWRGDELVTSFSDAGSDAPEKMGIVDETKAFLAAVRAGTGFTPGLEDCQQQVALMEAIRLRRTGPEVFPAPEAPR
jgi:myo-inositol 2-dehydrogenase/D-chiro-inositol 1-dehydrogenase